MKLYKIKKSNIDNKGLYAAKNIKVGTKIIYYKGKIITKKETEKKRTMDFGFKKEHHPPALYELLLKWKNERGYHWHKNPGARYHQEKKK